jgi:LysR family hydrogen peroxide-inducible transcriptional activator
MLTPIGQEVAERARTLLAATQDLVDLASSRQQPMSGQLRLGIIPTIAPFLLPRVLPRLRELYPDLRLALREDLTAGLLSRLDGGQLDFALIALPYETGNLLVEPLFDDDLWIVGRTCDAEIQRQSISASAELADRLLLLEEGHCLRDHALYACGHPDRQAAGAIEATSLLTLVQMIEAGLGMGLVPEMAVRSGLTDSPTLVARPLDKPCPKRTIALASRRSSTRQKEFAALADAFRQERTAAAS